jgi:hypothetical protein
MARQEAAVNRERTGPDNQSGLSTVNGYFQSHEVYCWTTNTVSGVEVLARIRYVYDLIKSRYYWVSTDHIQDADDRQLTAEQFSYFLLGLDGMRDSIARGDQGYVVLEHLLDDHL